MGQWQQSSFIYDTLSVTYFSLRFSSKDSDIEVSLKTKWSVQIYIEKSKVWKVLRSKDNWDPSQIYQSYKQIHFLYLHHIPMLASHRAVWERTVHSLDIVVGPLERPPKLDRHTKFSCLCWKSSISDTSSTFVDLIIILLNFLISFVNFHALNGFLKGLLRSREIYQ